MKPAVARAPRVVSRDRSPFDVAGLDVVASIVYIANSAGIALHTAGDKWHARIAPESPCWVLGRDPHRVLNAICWMASQAPDCPTG